MAPLSSVTTATGDDPGYDAISIAAMTVTEVDNDTIGVSVSAAATGVSVPEDGTGSYTIKLDTEPTHPVTIAVAGGG